MKRSFFARGAEEVAEDLLGCIVSHRLPNGRTLSARITETEAYVGIHDLACHASKGRTPRTEPLFGPPGHAYIYLIYGIYELFNVVCAPAGDAEAVLIRAGIPLNFEGELSGPGLFGKHMKLTRKLNRVDLCTSPRLQIERGTPPQKILRTARIGADYAGEWAKKPLRFMTSSSLAPSPK